MTTKLTLSLDKEVIKKAKKVAARQGMSLSKLVEKLLKRMDEDPGDNEDLHPVLKKLSGSVHVPYDLDYDQEIEHALQNKYVK
jgi:hypothetical protein